MSQGEVIYTFEALNYIFEASDYTFKALGKVRESTVAQKGKM